MIYHLKISEALVKKNFALSSELEGCVITVPFSEKDLIAKNHQI